MAPKKRRPRKAVSTTPQQSDLKHGWLDGAPGEDWCEPNSVDELDSDRGDAAESVDVGVLTAAEAAQELAGYIADLKYQGTLSAKQCCILSWWVVKSGVDCEALEMLAKAPGDRHTGNYHKRFDRAMAVDTSRNDHYLVRAASHNRAENCRSSIDIPVVLPWVSMRDELDDKPELSGKLSEAIDKRTLPPAYF